MAKRFFLLGRVVKGAHVDFPSREVKVLPALTEDCQIFLYHLANQRENIPVGKFFIYKSKSADNVPPAQILHRNRQSTAIRLYLIALWICRKDPFDTQPMSLKNWASLLNLPVASSSRTQKASRAIENLEKLNLVESRKSENDEPHRSVLRVKKDNGTGEEYQYPSWGGEMYFQVPVKMIAEGHLYSLSSSALIVYLALASERAYRTPIFFSGEKSFRKRFGISDSVRRKGVSELVSQNLLTVEEKEMELTYRKSKGGFGNPLNDIKLSKVYTLTGATVPKSGRGEGEKENNNIPRFCW